MASEPDRAGAASAVDGAAAAPEEPASTSGRKPTVALVIGMLYAFRLRLSMPHPPAGCIQKRSREATETFCPCNAGCIVQHTVAALQHSHMESAGAATNSPLLPHAVKQGVIVCAAGMAGSGKTALVRAMSAHMAERSMGGYVINLDPAVRQLPYEPNIDIRDTVRFR